MTTLLLELTNAVAFSTIWQVLRGLVSAARTREQLNHRAVESRDILGLAVGEQITVDNGFLIDDRRS